MSAPIRMPDIVNAQGQLIASVRPRFERAIRKACGDGTVCVGISVVPRDLPGMPEELTRCRFWEADRPPGTPVKRQKTTIVLFVGTKPCEPETTTTVEPIPAPEPEQPAPAPEPEPPAPVPEQPAPAPEPSPGGE